MLPCEQRMVRIFWNNCFGTKILFPDHTSRASGKFQIAVGACHCLELFLYPTGPHIQNEITYNRQAKWWYTNYLPASQPDSAAPSSFLDNILLEWFLWQDWCLCNKQIENVTVTSHTSSSKHLCTNYCVVVAFSLLLFTLLWLLRPPSSSWWCHSFTYLSLLRWTNSSFFGSLLESHSGVPTWSNIFLAGFHPFPYLQDPEIASSKQWRSYSYATGVIKEFSHYGDVHLLCSLLILLICASVSLKCTLAGAMSLDVAEYTVSFHSPSSRSFKCLPSMSQWSDASSDTTEVFDIVLTNRTNEDVKWNKERNDTAAARKRRRHWQNMLKCCSIQSCCRSQSS